MSENGELLPGSPRTWRDFRAALKRLMVRAEVTALAVERLSAGAEARRRGIESIADATVGRKIASKDEPVDARAVRAIVGACALAAIQRGETLPDADVQRWLKVRTALADPAPAAAVPEPAPLPEPPRRRRTWLVGAVAAVVIGAAAVVSWAGSGEPSAPRSTVAAGPYDDLVSGTPPCINPPDKAVGTSLSIAAPAPGTMAIGDTVAARGTVSLTPDERPPWLMLYAIGACTFYLQAPAVVDGGTWAGTIYFDPSQHGNFVAYAMVVDAATDQRLHEIAASSRSPFIVRLPVGARVAHVTVRCCA
jgi:hypothetical protein